MPGVYRYGHVVIDVPAALVPTYGPTLTVAATASTTVGEVKELAATALGVGKDDLSTLFEGTPLANDETTLGGAGVPNGGSIVATLSGDAPPSPFVVSVALPAGLQGTHGSTLTVATSASRSGSAASCAFAMGSS